MMAQFERNGTSNSSALPKIPRKMKFVYALFVVVATLIASSTASSVAGQSACREQGEIGQYYPHHIDPTHYWHCEQLNVPATERECPNDMAYMHVLRECIPWASWIWKKPETPPSSV